MTKPLGVRGEASPWAVWSEETVPSSERMGGNIGKSGNYRLKDQRFLLPLPPRDPAEPRYSTALAQDQLSHFDPGAHQKIPARGQQPAAQRLRGRWWEKSPEEEAQALLSDVGSWG